MLYKKCIGCGREFFESYQGNCECGGDLFKITMAERKELVEFNKQLEEETNW